MGYDTASVGFEWNIVPTILNRQQILEPLLRPGGGGRALCSLKMSGSNYPDAGHSHTCAKTTKVQQCFLNAPIT